MSNVEFDEQNSFETKRPQLVATKNSSAVLEIVKKKTGLGDKVAAAIVLIVLVLVLIICGVVLTKSGNVERNDVPHPGYNRD